MVIKKDSLTWITEFLNDNNISINPTYYLKEYLIKSADPIELPEDIINRIIGDAYGSSDNLVKDISLKIQKKFGIFLGRIQKEQLKKYIDYRFSEDFNLFFNMIKQDIDNNLNIKKFCDEWIQNSDYDLKKDVKTYITNLKNSIKENNSKRIKDYIIFLYSRLLGLNEKRNLSLLDIFNSNEKRIMKELSEKDFQTLKELCANQKKINRFVAIGKFNKEYIKLLEHNGGNKDKNSIIYLNITQELFNNFESKEAFLNYLFKLIKKSYEKLQNHKSLIIHIKDIFHNNINIKWQLYANLTIYAERFRDIKEERVYYKPEDICKDFIEHKYKVVLTKEDFTKLKLYYSNDSTRFFVGNLEIPKNILDYFKNIQTGFAFIDCFVLKKEPSKNTEDINFIKNENELLLIFNKHETDDRKIPCPICGSLNISGNSYPEVGIKSWECKNPLCSDRSKTNRGKRYSERTILMQDATFDFSEENQISKEIIKIWRKDVVEDWEIKKLYEMITKYFSFVNDSILAVNPEYPDEFLDISTKQKRRFVSSDYNNFLEIENSLEEYNQFFNRDLFKTLFLYKKDMIDNRLKNSDILKFDNKIKLLQGDAFDILSKFNDKTIHHMVTSPPYYNAREYSQWQNLFNYLNDMYNIILKSNEKLVDGGVFFYNIGDIFDNDNTIVKSKMGEKRIPLGAYTILIFEKAGFELLDNIIWYKGEPQSNRHKNDGNYTPYYQRPANCYEHMFIFKKSGKLHLNSNKKENILDSNIIRFTPVFKIFKGGENKYGHTAPFPQKIPLLSSLIFTSEGEIVLDPFSGSGTSSIVAAKNNRLGIGLELKKEYNDLAISRAKEENIEGIIIEKF